MSVANDTTRDIRVHPRFTAYAADAEGNILSLRSGKNLKPRPLNGGKYYLVAIFHDGERFDLLWHRFVLETFAGPCPEGMEACHKDHDPANNRPDNLRWGTHQSNMDDMIDANRSCRGEKHFRAIITDAQAIELLDAYANGATPSVLAKRFGLCPASVYAIVGGRARLNIDADFVRAARESHRSLRSARGLSKRNHRLRQDEVSEIKRMLAMGISQSEIATRFQIAQCSVSAIKAGRIHADVAEPVLMENIDAKP